MLSTYQIKSSPEKFIGWMCYDAFITLDNQVVDLSFNPRKERLIGGSYCFYVNGKYRTRKWIRENCVKVLGLIFSD
jgi:hypothetical protein